MEELYSKLSKTLEIQNSTFSNRETLKQVTFSSHSASHPSLFPAARRRQGDSANAERGEGSAALRPASLAELLPRRCASQREDPLLPAAAQPQLDLRPRLGVDRRHGLLRHPEH